MSRNYTTGCSRSTVIDGRLVYTNSTNRPSSSYTTSNFSWKRFVLLLVVVFYFHSTNPANYNDSTDSIHSSSSSTSSSTTGSTSTSTSTSSNTKTTQPRKRKFSDWIMSLYSYTQYPYHHHHYHHQQQRSSSNKNKPYDYNKSSHSRTNYWLFNVQEIQFQQPPKNKQRTTTTRRRATTKSNHHKMMNSILLSMGGMNIYCPLDTTEYYNHDNEEDSIGIIIDQIQYWISTFVCSGIIQEYMTHELPFLPAVISFRYNHHHHHHHDSKWSYQYPKNDIPYYTIHRYVALILILSYFLSLCYTTPKSFDNNDDSTHMMLSTGYLLRDSFLSFISYNDKHQPYPYTNRRYLSTSSNTFILLVRLLALNVIIYPTLHIMYRTVQQQNRNSIFNISSKYPINNYYFAVLIFFILAILINAITSKCFDIWNGNSSNGTTNYNNNRRRQPLYFLLQFQTLTALSVGYYLRYIQYNYNKNNLLFLHNYDIMSMLEPEEIKEMYTALVWTVLFLLLMKHSIQMFLSWYVAHAIGQIYYQYQYDHLFFVSTTQYLRNMIDSMYTYLNNVILQ